MRNYVISLDLMLQILIYVFIALYLFYFLFVCVIKSQMFKMCNLCALLCHEKL